MYIIPKAKCLANIEHFTKGKGKNNPNYTCLANARKHLKHNEMRERFTKMLNTKPSTTELREVVEYVLKHDLIDTSEKYKMYMNAMVLEVKL